MEIKISKKLLQNKRSTTIRQVDKCAYGVYECVSCGHFFELGKPEVGSYCPKCGRRIRKK